MTEQEWRDRFADRLDLMVKKRGVTRGELAEEAGLAESTICNYIGKNRLPKVTAVVNIARILGCRVKDLIDFGDTIDD